MKMRNSGSPDGTGGRRILLAASCLILSACSASNPITNLEPVAQGQSYQAEYRERLNDTRLNITPTSADLNTSHCKAQAAATTYHAPGLQQELLSPGDLLDVLIGNDETFSGKHEVSSDGKLRIHDLVAVEARGRTVNQVEAALAQALKAGNYYTSLPSVSVRLADYGTAHIYVTGAVFEPGEKLLGGSAIANNDDATRESALGAVADGRRLSRALQSSGGVRPDADLSRVLLRRQGKTHVLDMRNAIIGGAFVDPLVLSEDEIVVESRDCFQADLVVPSSVSPVGVKVFMSNLTEPALSNANSAINKDTREMRYGTRMMQTLVSMNCVGGSKLTNASRSAVLYSRNPVSGKSIVIERNIEDLIRHADRDDYDPFIMPEDALACYDSGTTDIVNIARGFGIVAGSIVLGRNL